MSTATSSGARTATVRANGIDVHYVEAGAPTSPGLVLLHGGLVSTNPLWDATPVSYGTHLPTITERFHVVAPDMRGYGKTRHTGTEPVSMSLRADDVAALIDVLGLTRPAVAGFSDGAMVATVAAIRHPGLARALVNDAGCDTFDPASGSFTMLRQVFGGSADATRADPDAVEAAFGADPEMSAFLALIKADHDASGGPGYWKVVLEHFFEAGLQGPGYGFDDFGSIDVPALILAGDHDDVSPVEYSVRGYRHLPQGQLYVQPNTGHVLTAGKVAAMMDFLLGSGD